MKPQVRWTSREWALLAQYFVDAGIDPDSYGFSRALNDAQMALLPSERWRAVKGVPAQMKKEIKTQIGMLERKMREELQQPVQHVPPPGPEALSTEDLLVELARRIAPLFEPKKPNPVDRAYFPPPMAQAAKAVEQGTKQEKIRILIIGPQPDQQKRLEEKFPTLCLKFSKVEDSSREVWGKGLNALEAILWTKFMTHEQQTVVKNLKIQTWYTNTMQQIEERLTTWATR